MSTECWTKDVSVGTNREVYRLIEPGMFDIEIRSAIMNGIKWNYVINVIGRPTLTGLALMELESSKEYVLKATLAEAKRAAEHMLAVYKTVKEYL
jgi:hypothetical protein